jgi:diguanylate cyclase (GGDEF)-like protein
VSISTEPLGPMARAVRHGHLVVINEPDWDKRLGGDAPRIYAHRYVTGNCVICPLQSRSRVVGVLNLADKADNQPFDDLVDLIPIRQVAELLGASIHNIELYRSVQEQARLDGMTGLANHTTFMAELAREIHRSARYDTPLSLILLDLDRLKAINDTLGHLAGDEALRIVAGKIRESIRDSDLGARFGGDEFAIVLPSTSLGPAEAVAQRLVGAISSSKVTHNGVWQALTVSVGVGQYGPDATAAQFIGQVDAALYAAKAEGRNRIALHT